MKNRVFSVCTMKLESDFGFLNTDLTRNTSLVRKKKPYPDIFTL